VQCKKGADRHTKITNNISASLKGPMVAFLIC
jgi:hypothetical protein